MFAGLLVAGALTAEPVRHWIHDHVNTLTAALRPAPGAPPQARPGAGTARVPTRVGFVPRGDTVIIRIDHGQADGAVTLFFEDRSDVTGEVVTPDPEAELIVLPPNGFRVRNAESDTRSYRFHVPIGLHVEILIDGIRRAQAPRATTEAVEVTLHPR